MVKAMETAFGNRKHIICFAHFLNFVAFRAIEAVLELKPNKDKVKKVVTWFKHSVKSNIVSDYLIYPLQTQLLGWLWRGGGGGGDFFFHLQVLHVQVHH